jgi:hypothetical protein
MHVLNRDGVNGGFSLAEKLKGAAGAVFDGL